MFERQVCSYACQTVPVLQRTVEELECREAFISLFLPSRIEFDLKLGLFKGLRSWPNVL